MNAIHYKYLHSCKQVFSFEFLYFTWLTNCYCFKKKALNYIGLRIKSGIKRYEDQKKKTKTERAKELLNKILIAHVPVNSD